MKIVGITGGIGSGKSTVTDYLRQEGYRVIDADEVAREAVLPGASVLTLLVETFGDEVLLPSGELNRKRLAEMAFTDEEKTKELNEITHKDILRRIDEQIQEVASAESKANGSDSPRSDILFLSAPLLFETNLEKKCDIVWLISAPEKVRAKRAAMRDNTTIAQIESRIIKQMPEKIRRARADIVIENNKTKTDLINQIKANLY